MDIKIQILRALVACGYTLPAALDTYNAYCDRGRLDTLAALVGIE